MICWSTSGADYKTKTWVGSDHKPCSPHAFLHYYAKLAHGNDHIDKGGMCSAVNSAWYTRGFTRVAEDFCKKRYSLLSVHVRSIIHMPKAGNPPPDRPFNHLMMDFIELTQCENKKYCLVIVDMFSKWIEVFPSSKQDAKAVAKALLKEIIPMWGIPTGISREWGKCLISIYSNVTVLLISESRVQFILRGTITDLIIVLFVKLCCGL